MISISTGVAHQGSSRDGAAARAPSAGARRALVLLLAFAAFAAGCRQRPAVPEGFQGLLEYDQRLIGFEQPGRVSEVPVHRGQTVKAGDVLARLDDALAVASRDARQAELEAARADLALLMAGTRREDVAASTDEALAAAAEEAWLRRTAERERALLLGGATPAEQAEKADAELSAASARRAALQSRVAAQRGGARPQELARAEANVNVRASVLAEESERLDRHVLRAMGDGTVLDVTIKPGEVAAPGTPAVVLADVEHPYTDVFVPEGQLGALQIGTPAEARVDAWNEPFRAVVEYVSPEAEFTPKFLFSDRERPSLVIRARVRIEDPRHRLHSGVPVFVRVAR